MEKIEKFIEKSNIKYQNKYDYSKALYVGVQKPLEIICPEHGSFWQTPDVHLHSKYGCPKCAMSKHTEHTTGTTEDFIVKARKIHGDKYDYSKTVYKGTKEKLTITCPVHGDFEQLPWSHVGMKCGCPRCVGWNKTTEEWIRKAQKVHGNKYDYSKAVFKNSETKVTIVCPIHGEFYQNTNCHIILGHGCPECGKEKSILLSRQRGSNVSTEDFILKARKIHGNKYLYNNVHYVNTYTKVEIICPKHGSFWQAPNSHLRGSGCRKCHESKGEKAIRVFLENRNILHEIEYKFKNCAYKQPLRFDFYLPDYNTCIEFDGKQHFINNNRFSDTLELIQERDQIKNKYCKDNNIKLIRISYKQIDEVEDILEKELSV